MAGEAAERLTGIALLELEVPVANIDPPVEFATDSLETGMQPGLRRRRDLARQA